MIRRALTTVGTVLLFAVFAAVTAPIAAVHAFARAVRR